MEGNVYSWDDVSDKDINEFIEKLMVFDSENNIRDCDNDKVLEIDFVDRRRFQSKKFLPIPYEHKSPKEYEEIIMFNLGIAVKMVNDYMCRKWYTEKNNG